MVGFKVSVSVFPDAVSIATVGLVLSTMKLNLFEALILPRLSFMRMVTLCLPSSNPDPFMLAFQKLVPDVIDIECTEWFEPLVTLTLTVLILVNASRKVKLNNSDPLARLVEKLPFSTTFMLCIGLLVVVRIGPLRSIVMVPVEAAQCKIVRVIVVVVQS